MYQIKNISVYLVLLTFSSLFSSESNYGLPTTRFTTLRSSLPYPTELEYHRLTTQSTALSYVLPRSSIHETDHTVLPLIPSTWPFGLTLESKSTDYSLQFQPVLGIENRREKIISNNASNPDLYLPTTSIDLGINVFGHKGPVGFYLDARIFTEMRDTLLGYGRAIDREFLETQSDLNSKSINYTSYARYRSQLSLDLSWGRWLFAHDSPHWGPGLYTNLVFQEEAIPFDFLQYSTVLGPLRIVALYGRLQLDSMARHQNNNHYRVVYAHRLEWNLNPQILLGLSEQLIFYNHEEPWAFAPIVPLFMHKGLANEGENNGNIAFDISWKIHNLARIYSEFLIDDLQSPSALFDDYWGNRWAWMVGLQVAKNWNTNLKFGLIVEYSRVEPYVYMHYTASTAQAANSGYPLGNPFGPNSQTLTTKLYSHINNFLYIGSQMNLIWKGTDHGSSLYIGIREYDPDYNPELTKKKFIYGVARPFIANSLFLGLKYHYFSLQGQLVYGTEYSWNLRLQMN